MFKLFNRNTVGAYVALPILLILLRLRLILYPLEGFTPLSTDLFTPVWNNIFGHVEMGSTLSIALSLFFILIVAYTTNSICNTFHFAEHQSMLAAMYCIVISSGFVISYGLHPVHIFALFFCLALISLFKASDKSKPMPLVYNAFLFATIGFLFWSKGLWYFPLLFFLLFFLRISGIRCVLAALLGLLTPLSAYATWLFLHDKFIVTAQQYWQMCVVDIPFFRMGIYTISYSCLVVATLFFAVLNAIGNLPKLSILESRYTRSLTFATTLIVASIALPQFSFEILPLVAISGGILLAAMMQRIKNYAWAELLTTAMIVITIAIQWLVKG